MRQYVKNAKTVAKCRNRCEKGTVARGVIKRSPLNVCQYPSVSSLILGHYQRGEEVTPICYCVKQQSGMQFVYACNGDDLKTWVGKKCVHSFTDKGKLLEVLL